MPVAPTSGSDRASVLWVDSVDLDEGELLTERAKGHLTRKVAFCEQVTLFDILYSGRLVAAKQAKYTSASDAESPIFINLCNPYAWGVDEMHHVEIDLKYRRTALDESSSRLSIKRLHLDDPDVLAHDDDDDDDDDDDNDDDNDEVERPQGPSPEIWNYIQPGIGSSNDGCASERAPPVEGTAAETCTIESKKRAAVDELERAPKRLATDALYIDDAELTDADADGEEDEDYTRSVSRELRNRLVPITGSCTRASSRPSASATRRSRSSHRLHSRSRIPSSSSASISGPASAATSTTTTTTFTPLDAASKYLGSNVSFPDPIRRLITPPSAPGHVNIGLDDHRSSRCSICGKFCPHGLGDLSRHVLTHIRFGAAGDVGVAKLWRCGCGKELAREDSLKRHRKLLSHSGGGQVAVQSDTMLVQTPQGSWASVNLRDGARQ
ncbi:hypothetical protein HDZ31DRAFT_73586 [Schizophyllum fasciatum]